MFVLFWLFVGVLTGLLVVSVFVPPNKKNQELPTPRDTSVFHTKDGCVKFKSEEVECDGTQSSLNLLASKK
jgi:hypothetical protein